MKVNMVREEKEAEEFNVIDKSPIDFKTVRYPLRVPTTSLENIRVQLDYIIQYLLSTV